MINIIKTKTAINSSIHDTVDKLCEELIKDMINKGNPVYEFRICEKALDIKESYLNNNELRLKYKQVEKKLIIDSLREARYNIMETYFCSEFTVYNIYI